MMNRRKLDTINTLVDQGYTFVRQVKPINACNSWLSAWELVKQLKTPEMRHPEAFTYTYFHYLTQPIEYWTGELAWQLHNAGLHDSSYNELRIGYVDDYLQQFPDELKGDPISFLRSKAVGLWQLGRQEEAEAEFASIVENYPDKAWGYIGWSDKYWLSQSSAKEYAKAEPILLQALERPNLEERREVLKRLYDLYEESEEIEKADAIAERMVKEPDTQFRRSPLPEYIRNPPPIPDELRYEDDDDDNDHHYNPKRKLGRNEPCWCGSGKKYKKCHWRKERP